MAAPNYDDMADEAEAEDPDATEDAAEPSDDDEFMMAAEEAGFTGDKAKALWRAIDRCVELKGALPMAEEEEAL